MATPASSIPAPHKLPRRHGLALVNSRLVACRMLTMRPGVSVGLRPTIIDTVPATSGAEKLVPTPCVYEALPGTVVPSLESENAESDFPPSPDGAEMSTRRPKFE